jgi:hypothetical protein
MASTIVTGAHGKAVSLDRAEARNPPTAYFLTRESDGPSAGRERQDRPKSSAKRPGRGGPPQWTEERGSRQGSSTDDSVTSSVIRARLIAERRNADAMAVQHATDVVDDGIEVANDESQNGVDDVGVGVRAAHPFCEGL